jgi:hypothetical protein
MSLSGSLLAGGFVFLVSDIVYVLDHYFVHHDRERYARTHARHHRRYNGPKDAPHLDPGERATYNTAGAASCVGASVLTLYTGNPGFLVGALLKWAHSLLFHLYQHRWWGEVPVGNQGIARPRAWWGMASWRYHAYHHTQPNDGRFTYAESWAGFDRLLELAHPWLVRFTADHRRAAKERRHAAAPRRRGAPRLREPRS